MCHYYHVYIARLKVECSMVMKSIASTRFFNVFQCYYLQ
jgi:hypothetical protein